MKCKNGSRMSETSPILLNILEVMTLIAVACLTISEFGGYYLIITTIGKYSRLLRSVAWGIFVVKILLTRYNKKEFTVILVLSILGYLNCIKSGNVEIAISIAMILSLKNVSLKKVFIVCFASVLAMLIVLGYLSVAGIAGKLAITQDYGRECLETRYYFGFYHPNQWAHAVFMLLLFATMAFWEKINWKAVVLMVVINLTAYKFAISRTALICGMLLIVMILIYKYGVKEKNKKRWNYFVGLGVGSVWLFALYCVSDFQGAMFLREKIDLLLNGRLWQAKTYITEYSPTLFGEQIPDTFIKNIVLDFGYIRFLLENGVIIYLLMIILTVMLCIYAAKRDKYNFLIGVICITLYGIHENISMSMVPANVSMILFAELLWGRFPVISKNIKK